MKSGASDNLNFFFCISYSNIIAKHKLDGVSIYIDIYPFCSMINWNMILPVKYVAYKIDNQSIYPI